MAYLHPHWSYIDPLNAVKSALNANEMHWFEQAVQSMSRINRLKPEHIYNLKRIGLNLVHRGVIEKYNVQH